MDENNAISVIEDLIETCKDGQKGYQDAATHVKRADLKTYFNEQSLERGRFCRRTGSGADPAGQAGQESFRFSVGGAAPRLDRYESQPRRRRQDDSGVGGGRRGQRQGELPEGADRRFAGEYRADRSPAGGQRAAGARQSEDPAGHGKSRVVSPQQKTWPRIVTDCPDTDPC